jgi:hypothetical protein
MTKISYTQSVRDEIVRILDKIEIYASMLASRTENSYKRVYLITHIRFKVPVNTKDASVES